MRKTIWMAMAVAVLFSLNSWAAVDEKTAPTPQATQPAVDIPPIYIEKTITLKRNQTLAEKMINMGFDAQQVYTLLRKVDRKYRLRKLKTGQDISIFYAEGEQPLTIGQLDGIIFHTHDDKTVQLVKDKNGRFIAKADPRKMIIEKATSVGVIKDSLYASAKKADLPSRLVVPFANLFAWELDFTRDLRPNDTFRVIYEKLYDQNGNFIRSGEVIAAELVTRGKIRQAFRYKDENGYTQYYDAEGRNKRRALLRTPLEFTRISSHFNPNRKHPILGYTRAHKGTDFAAPRGTPVKAAGDGVIEYAAWNGGYGRFIRIRHDNTYKTAYAHLHRYARGIKKGKRVKQGQVIGYVGTSGRSTGPHLHYEVLKHDRQVNAMRVKLPKGKQLPKSKLPQFKEYVASLQTFWSDKSTMLATAQ